MPKPSPATSTYGYEGADDLNHQRADCAFKLACCRLPESGMDLMRMLIVHTAIPVSHCLAKAEFATIPLRLLKLSTRIRESASRLQRAFASCPEADLLRHLAVALAQAPA